MQENKEIWSKILTEIELEVSRANFLTLFKRTQLLSVEENVITIAAPSAMIIDLLQRRFYDVIKKSADKHIGKNTKIIFVPKTIIDAVKPQEDAHGPLFEEDADKKTCDWAFAKSSARLYF